MSARPYQTELYHRALQHNVVAYLDTGAGKTLVSVLLMQHFIAERQPISDDLVQEWRQRQAAIVSSSAAPEQITDQVAQLDSEIRRRLPEQSKKVVFLVPTIPLVDQQSRVIQQYASSSSVGNFSSSTIGDLDPDSADNNNNNETSRSKRVPWDYIAWQVELSKYQVLVMTPAIFLALLRQPSNFNIATHFRRVPSCNQEPPVQQNNARALPYDPSFKFKTKNIRNDCLPHCRQCFKS